MPLSMVLITDLGKLGYTTSAVREVYEAASRAVVKLSASPAVQHELQQVTHALGIQGMTTARMGELIGEHAGATQGFLGELDRVLELDHRLPDALAAKGVGFLSFTLSSWLEDIRHGIGLSTREVLSGTTVSRAHEGLKDATTRLARVAAAAAERF